VKKDRGNCETERAGSENQEYSKNTIYGNSGTGRISRKISVFSLN
jgi:hypothetical protein